MLLDRAAVIEFDHENPKTVGTKSNERYEIYKVAKTVGHFLDLGGLTADLRFDASHRQLGREWRGCRHATATQASTFCWTPSLRRPHSHDHHELPPIPWEGAGRFSPRRRKPRLVGAKRSPPTTS